MGFPSEIQIVEAAKRLSEGDDGFIRTSGLWHVLMFLRYRACHNMVEQHTFGRGPDFAETAFDLNGLTLPVEKKARNAYFEPGASQGINWSQFFRHYEGPRQTYLYRIYTGLTGKGQNQPKLFDATFEKADNTLPATVNLAANWLKTLRANSGNEFVLDHRTQELVTWIFRFGVPNRNGQTAHVAELADGALMRANGVVMLPVPESINAVSEALRKYLGLGESDLRMLLPQLERVRPNEWNQSTGVTVAALSEPLQSYLGLNLDTQQAAKQQSKSELLNSEELNLFLKSFDEDSSASGLIVNPALLIRFVASLLSKRFLILTGLAGSGKTKLAQAFAHWLTADPGWIDPDDHLKGKHPNQAYSLVPVGADWTGSDHILGYPDGLVPPRYDPDGNLIPGKYITKPALDLILAAREHPTKPYFLILDEMNLSHVERYFADVLSMIESGEGVTLYCDERDAAGTPMDTRGFDPIVKLPLNVFVIGTVNVDETTYMFSPKVLDRGNVIEFRITSDDIENFLNHSVQLNLEDIVGKGAGFASHFIRAAGAATSPLETDEKLRFDAEMSLCFLLFVEHGGEFGFRVVNEALRFMQAYKMLGDVQIGSTLIADGPMVENSQRAINHAAPDWFDHGFDAIIMQKFLPKLHGSKAKLGPLLKKIYAACVQEHTDSPRDAKAYAAELNKLGTSSKLSEPSRDLVQSARYAVSAEKITRMWRQLNENGFTAFSEN